MVKIGRNAPCPCGSGKKYKKCCLGKEQTESFTRSLIHRKMEELIPQMIEYGEKNFEEDVIRQGWEDFYGPDSEFEIEANPYSEMFIRWFLFFWIPDEEEYGNKEEQYPSPYTIGARYLKDNESKLDSPSKRILQSSLNDPLSYWQVETVRQGKGVFLKDLLLGRDCFVEEVEGSKHLHRWDIVLANMVELDGVYVFNITSPFSLPASAKGYIENEFGSSFEGLEEEEAISQLFELDFDLIYLYQDLSDEIFARAMPEFRNMDGKELIFTKSTYQFNPSDRAAIISALQKIEEFELETDTEKSEDLFIWIDEPDNSSLMDHIVKGRIEIGRKYLKTDCNSAERDNQLRLKLQDVLNGRITHRKTTSERLDMSGLDDRAQGEISGQKTGALNLEELPEDARAELIEHMESIYMKWADTPVPALGNITPREAVKSAEGNKQVQSLIIDWENSQSRVENPQFKFDFNKLRKALGLPSE